MEEIKIGEYVRTETGKIDKVTNPDFYMKMYIECENHLIPKNSIVKHSPNIIDLIEVGDYVNGEEIVKKIKHWLETAYNAIREDHIKTIVTKEQFAAIEYKVEV